MRFWDERTPFLSKYPIFRKNPNDSPIAKNRIIERKILWWSKKWAEKQDRNGPVIIIKKTHYWLVKNTNERIKKGWLTKRKKFTRYDLSASKVSLTTNIELKRKEKFLSFEIVWYMRWIESSSSIYYLFQLSCMDLDTHKKPQKKEFCFMVVPYTSALSGLNVRTKL